MDEDERRHFYTIGRRLQDSLKLEEFESPRLCRHFGVDVPFAADIVRGIEPGEKRTRGTTLMAVKIVIT